MYLNRLSTNNFIRTTNIEGNIHINHIANPRARDFNGIYINKQFSKYSKIKLITFKLLGYFSFWINRFKTQSISLTNPMTSMRYN